MVNGTCLGTINNYPIHPVRTNQHLSEGVNIKCSNLTIDKWINSGSVFVGKGSGKDIQSRNIKLSDDIEVDRFLSEFEEYNKLTKSERRTIKSKARKSAKRLRRKKREKEKECATLNLSAEKLLISKVKDDSHLSKELNKSSGGFLEEKSEKKRRYFSPNMESLEVIKDCSSSVIDDIHAAWGEQYLTEKHRKAKVKKLQLKPKSTGKEWRSKGSRVRQRKRHQCTRDPYSFNFPVYLDLRGYFRTSSVHVLDGSVPHTLKSIIGYNLLSFVGSASGAIQSELGIDGHVNPRSYQQWSSTIASWRKQDIAGSKKSTGTTKTVNVEAENPTIKEPIVLHDIQSNNLKTDIITSSRRKVDRISPKISYRVTALNVQDERSKKNKPVSNDVFLIPTKEVEKEIIPKTSFFLFPQADARPVPLDHWSNHYPASPEEYLKQEENVKKRSKRRVLETANPEAYFKLMLDKINIRGINSEDFISLKGLLDQPLVRRFYEFSESNAYIRKVEEVSTKISQLKSSSSDIYSTFKGDLLDMTAMAFVRNSRQYQEVYREYWDRSKEALVLYGKNYVDENFPKFHHLDKSPQAVDFPTSSLSDTLLTRLLVDQASGRQWQMTPAELAMVFARLDFNSYVNNAIYSRSRELDLLPVTSGMINRNALEITKGVRTSFIDSMDSDYGIKNADKGFFYSQSFSAVKGASVSVDTGTCLAFSFSAMMALESQDMDSLANLYKKAYKFDEYIKTNDPLVQQQIDNGMDRHNSKLQHSEAFKYFFNSLEKYNDIDALINRAMSTESPMAVVIKAPDGSHAITINNILMPSPIDPADEISVKVFVDANTGIFPCFDQSELEHHLKYSISLAHESIDNNKFDPRLDNVGLFAREINHEELTDMKSWKTDRNYGVEDFFSKRPEWFYEHHRTALSSDWETIFSKNLEVNTDLHNPRYQSNSVVNEYDLIKSAMALKSTQLDDMSGNIARDGSSKEVIDIQKQMHDLNLFYKRMEDIDDSAKVKYRDKLLSIYTNIDDQVAPDNKLSLRLNNKVTDDSKILASKKNIDGSDYSIAKYFAAAGKAIMDAIPMFPMQASSRNSRTLKVDLGNENIEVKIKGKSDHVSSHSLSEEVSHLFLSDEDSQIIKESMTPEKMQSLKDIADMENQRLLMEFESIKTEISDHITSRGMTPESYELRGVVDGELKFSFRGEIRLNDMPEAITVRGEIADRFLSFTQRVSNTIETGFSDISSSQFVQNLRGTNFGSTFNSLSAKGAKLMGVAAKFIALQTATNLLNTINKNKLPVTAKFEIGLRLSDAIGDTLANSAGAINFAMKKLAGDLVSKFVTLSPVAHSMNMGSFGLGTLVNLGVLGVQSYELHMSRTALDREIKGIRVFMTSLTAVIQFSGMFSPHPAVTMAIFAVTIILNKVEEAIIEDLYNQDLLKNDFKQFDKELATIKELFKNPKVIFKDDGNIVTIENKAAFIEMVITKKGVSITRNGNAIKTAFFESVNHDLKEAYDVYMYDVNKPENHLKSIYNPHDRKIAQQSYAVGKDVSAASNDPVRKKNSQWTKGLASNYKSHMDANVLKKLIPIVSIFSRTTSNTGYNDMQSRANFTIQEHSFDDTVECLLKPSHKLFIGHYSPLVTGEFSQSEKANFQRRWNYFKHFTQSYRNKAKPTQQKPKNIIFNGVPPKVKYIEEVPKAVSQSSAPVIYDQNIFSLNLCSNWKPVSKNHFVTNLSGMPLATLPKVFLYEGRLVYFKTMLNKGAFGNWVEGFFSEDTDEWSGMSEYYGLNAPDHAILEPQRSIYFIQAGTGFIYHFAADIQSIRAAAGKLNYFTYKDVTNEHKNYRSLVKKCESEKKEERQRRLEKKNYKGVYNEDIETCRTLKDHFPHGFIVNKEKTKSNYETIPDSTAYALKVLANEDHQMVLSQGVRITLTETTSSKKGLSSENHLKKKSGQYYFFLKPDNSSEFKLTVNYLSVSEKSDAFDRVFTFDFSAGGRRETRQEQEIQIKAKSSVTRNMMFVIPVSMGAGQNSLPFQLSIDYDTENNLLDIFSIKQLPIFMGESQTTKAIIGFLKKLEINNPNILIKTFPVNNFSLNQSRYHESIALQFQKSDGKDKLSSKGTVDDLFSGFGYCVIPEKESLPYPTASTVMPSRKPDIDKSHVVYLIYRAETPEHVKKQIHRLGYLGSIPVTGHTLPTEIAPFLHQEDRIHYFYDDESRILVRQYGLTEIRYWIEEDYKVCPMGADPILMNIMQNGESLPIFECSPIYKENRESQEVVVLFPKMIQRYQADNKSHNNMTDPSAESLNLFSFIQAQSPYSDERVFTLLGGRVENKRKCSSTTENCPPLEDVPEVPDFSVAMQMFVADDNHLHVAIYPGVASPSELLAINPGMGYVLYAYEYSQVELEQLPAVQRSRLSDINGKRESLQLPLLTPIKMVAHPLITGDMLDDLSTQLSASPIIPHQFLSEGKIISDGSIVITLRDLAERECFICETLDGAAFALSYDLNNKNLIGLSGDFFIHRGKTPYIPDQARDIYFFAKLEFGKPTINFIKVTDYQPEYTDVSLPEPSAGTAQPESQTDNLSLVLTETKPMVFMDTVSENPVYIPTNQSLPVKCELSSATVVLAQIKIGDDTSATAFDNTNRLLVTVSSSDNPRTARIVDFLPLLHAGMAENTFYLSLMPTDNSSVLQTLPVLPSSELVLQPVFIKTNKVYSPVLIIPPLMQQSLYSITLDSPMQEQSLTKVQRISLNTGNDVLRCLITESSLEKTLILIIKANNRINGKMYTSVNQALQIKLRGALLDDGSISSCFDGAIVLNGKSLTVGDLTDLAANAIKRRV